MNCRFMKENDYYFNTRLHRLAKKKKKECFVRFLAKKKLDRFFLITTLLNKRVKSHTALHLSKPFFREQSRFGKKM